MTNNFAALFNLFEPAREFRTQIFSRSTWFLHSLFILYFYIGRYEDVDNCVAWYIIRQSVKQREHCFSEDFFTRCDNLRI